MSRAPWSVALIWLLACAATEPDEELAGPDGGEAVERAEPAAPAGGLASMIEGEAPFADDVAWAAEHLPPGEPGPEAAAGCAAATCGAPVKVAGIPAGLGLECWQYGPSFEKPLLVVEPLDSVNASDSMHPYIRGLIAPLRDQVLCDHGCFFDYCTLNLPDGRASIFNSETDDWGRIAGSTSRDQARQVEAAAAYIFDELVVPDTKWGYANTDLATSHPDYRRRRVVVVGLSAGGVSSVAGLRRRERRAASDPRGRHQVASAVLTFDSPLNGAQIEPKLQRIIHRCKRGEIQQAKLAALPSQELLRNYQRPTSAVTNCLTQGGDFVEDRTASNRMFAAWRAMGNEGFPLRSGEHGTHVITLAQSSPEVGQGCSPTCTGCFLHGPPENFLTKSGDACWAGLCKSFYLNGKWMVFPGSYYDFDGEVNLDRPFTFIANESARWHSWNGSGINRAVWDSTHTPTAQPHDEVHPVNMKALLAYTLEYLSFDGDGGINPANVWGVGLPNVKTCKDTHDGDPLVRPTCPAGAPSYVPAYPAPYSRCDPPPAPGEPAGDVDPSPYPGPGGALPS